MKSDLTLLNTGDLEKAARHPRNREDARAIAEELASRRQLYKKDTGALPLFSPASARSLPAVAGSPTSEAKP